MNKNVDAPFVRPVSQRKRGPQPNQHRKITIEYVDKKWVYKFEGKFNALLLQKVAKGLKRGYLRSKREGIDKAKFRHRGTNRPLRIPKERPKENLGADPRPYKRPQVSMPIAEGMNVPVHAPVREPDSAALQPDIKFNKEDVGEKKDEG